MKFEISNLVTNDKQSVMYWGEAGFRETAKPLHDLKDVRALQRKNNL